MSHFKDGPSGPPRGEQGPVGQDRYIDQSLRSFLVKLGGRTAEPAGGAALALAGASAAALMSLTCHAGMRADSEEGSADLLASCQRDSEGLAQRIQHLVDADVLAYRGVTKALRAAQGTAEQRAQRAERLETALVAATEVPLEVAEAGLDILELALEVHGTVGGPVIGDLAAAVHLAEAAVKGSLRNAHINVAAMSNAADSRAAEARIGEIRTRLDTVAEALHAGLRQRGIAG